MQWVTADSEGRVPGVVALYPPRTRLLIDPSGAIGGWEYPPETPQVKKEETEQEGPAAPLPDPQKGE